MDRQKLLHHLNQLLEIDRFADFCPNGLQVEGKSEIRKIVAGVSVGEKLFRAAVEKQADMIIVHHGMFWQKDPHPYFITGYRKRRLELLIKNDINLVAYHLPLDAHRQLGNNIQILRRLNIEPLEAMEIGFIGIIRNSLTILDLHENIDHQLETRAMLFDFGPEQVEKVLVISGSSSSAIEKAAELGVDTFIGGDIREEHVRICEELGLNFIAAGHYNSEKFGVKALTEYIKEKFNLNMEFIDISNPV
ncbi:MAG TPA: Nif3-like dinuclear metal center hexameric protein [Bacteroidetes bacterium]|nr:Nif3-like dinuclear metal center hexameric protein [Bacteroidota bacterium]